MDIYIDMETARKFQKELEELAKPSHLGPLCHKNSYTLCLSCYRVMLRYFFVARII